MRYWQELVTSAVVGIERQAPPLPPAASPLGDALQPVADRSPEARLLAAAGAAALYRCAGLRPAREEGPLLPEAGGESRPVCSPAAAQHLATMLGGAHREALPEWLAAAAARGLRVPEYLLPDLLQAGRQQRELRELIQPVAGSRGAWLAAQNPEWGYLAGEVESEAVWETGTRAARQLFLARLRASDPARARELLSDTWTQEPADDRAAFLSTFAAGLSLADEPFLEAALADRSKTVRQTAVELLSRLPASGLVRRMEERVRPLLRFEPGGAPRLMGLLRKKVQVQITLPRACDEAMLRDGVEPKPPQSEKRFGERAWWLLQILSAVPPSRWCEVGKASPAELIEVPEPDDRVLLVEAWAAAAERHADVEWAEALLEGQAAPPERRAGLASVIPPERREGLARKLLRTGSGPLQPGHPAFQMLLACPAPWGEELSREFLAALRARLTSPSPRQEQDWNLASQLSRFALALSPALAPAAEGGWPADAAYWSYWKNPVEQFVALLHFRREMLEEIQRCPQSCANTPSSSSPKS